MAVVNVDLSEYDAIRKRNSELEEQVKELKKLNESLKSGSKVILRKETVVIERFFRKRSIYDDMFYHQPKGIIRAQRTDTPLNLLSPMLTLRMSALKSNRLCKMRLIGASTTETKKNKPMSK